MINSLTKYFYFVIIHGFWVDEKYPKTLFFNSIKTFNFVAL